MTPNALTSAGLNVHLENVEQTQTPATESFETLDSIETLHDLYRDRIFRFLLSSVRDRDLAQSLTQDTFIRAWGARDKFRGECAIATWLMRIALNLLRDHTRTNRFRFWKQAASTAVDASDVAGHLPVQQASAEDRMIAREQVALIAQTVSTLSERQRTVFLLRFVEELDLNQIATITDLPVSTVKTHLYRGLAIVRAKHSGSGSNAPGKDLQ
jgi:RNA polymerase sigma-70 factor (ECF subfamily)